MADDWQPAGAKAPDDDWQQLGQQSAEPPPQPFLDRFMRGDALKRAVAPFIAAGKGAAEGFGSEPLGLSDEHVHQLMDAGIFRDPATGRGGAVRFMNEAIGMPLSVVGDLALRTGGAAVGAISSAVGQMVEDSEGALGTGPRAKEETANFLNYLLLRGDHEFGRAEHVPMPSDQPIGVMPREQDFTVAAQALSLTVRRVDNWIEQNLRDLWEQRGIHPAEAVADAQGDALLKHQLVTQPYNLTDHSGITPPVGSPVPHGTPRSESAMTGDPRIDRILESDVTRHVIDNPIINRDYTIPYTAGGSVPLEDPTFFIDRRFPQSFTIDGVTFDPAAPFAVHENVEQHVMDLLVKGGMSNEEAYRVAHFEFAEKAEGAWYAAHGIDQAKAEAAYAPIMAEIQKAPATDIPPNLYTRPYPHDQPSAAKHESLDEPKPSKDEINRAHAILDAAEQEMPLRAVGAEVAGELPDFIKEPPPAPGRLADRGRQTVDKLFSIGRDVQFMLDPMSTGSNRAMALAKDTEGVINRIRWERLRTDQDIVKRFSPEQWERMWNAADEESVLRQEGKASEHMGLATLTPEERATVEQLHAKAQAAWLHAADAGIVEGEGLPAYTPRMVLNVAAADAVGPRALNELGRNVFTRTAQMLHRKFLTAEETEAAAQKLVAKRMQNSGATPEEIAAAVEKVKIARNIRALPLASARLEEAAVWKEMINKIEEMGKSVGQETVSVGIKPGSQWFTIAGHPAFTKWAPDFEIVDGKATPRLDQDGNTIFTAKPIWISSEFKGPLTALLDEGPTNKLYAGLMALKGKSMTAILNSPLIHNEVVWSKAMEAAGGREWLGFGLYFRGNRIVKNPARSAELIERGLNPIGPRGSYQDISGLMEEPNMEAGRSWTAQVLGFIPGLFDAGAETKVMRAIDKAGDFTHNMLLWNRVRDLQFGLADHLSDRLVGKGLDRLTADRIAGHFSNIIVGSIPKSAMSAGARATANMLLFSRSFTLGNLATYKQAVAGLPKPILAQIERDFGLSAEEVIPGEAAADAAKLAQGIARRKAISTIALSVGMYHVGNALIQHAFNIAARDSTVEQEMQGYARRYSDLMKAVQKDPFELIHLISRLSPTYDNEPKKQDRAHIGYDKDGTAYYARNPTGKFGEELIGYPTQLMEMVRRKLSPLAGGLLEDFQNDKGFGRKIYDDNDTSLSGEMMAVFNSMEHLVERHLPMQQISALGDLLRDQGDKTVNWLRAAGPIAGFTTSVGAPGGMARGEQLAAKQAFDTRFNLAWPDIRKQVQGGDIDGAREALRNLGVPPRMVIGLIRNATNPAGALHGRTLRDFYQYSTPEQQERLERAR